MPKIWGLPSKLTTLDPVYLKVDPLPYLKVDPLPYHSCLSDCAGKQDSTLCSA